MHALPDLSNVEEAVLNARVAGAGMPVLIVFWRPGHLLCENLGLVLEHVAEEFAGRVAFWRIDIDQAPAVARRMGIQEVPAVAVFDGETRVDQRVGVAPLRVYRQMLERALIPYTA